MAFLGFAHFCAVVGFALLVLFSEGLLGWFDFVSLCPPKQLFLVAF